MLKFIRRIFPSFMAATPPKIKTLLPAKTEDTDIKYWCSWILSIDVEGAKTCFLTQLDHCKALKAPQHEFLKAYLTLHLNGATHKVRMVIHRTAVQHVEADPNPAKPQRTPTASLASLQSNISSESQSPSKLSDHTLGILEKGRRVLADDRVIVIKSGQDFEDACTANFGSYITLTSLSIDEGHTRMSALQFATALEVTHNLAPYYTLKKYMCYWYALIVYLLVHRHTGGSQINNNIKKRGKFWWIAPTHTADDDQNVAEEEYNAAWARFQVSHYRFSFIDSS
jgi:hypothetical protein